LAQEESRNISENVSWGWRKRMADGKVSLPYSRFIGYEKGEDGQPKVVESEAKTVRLIYALFLEGKTYYTIARYLTKNRIPTPSGKHKPWAGSTIKSILQNEKYRGSALLQKGFTVDYLTKRKKKNEGEVPQYWIEESHPSIVAPDAFDLVQAEIERRKGSEQCFSSRHVFSSKIVCGSCGGFYGSKIWHSTDAYRRTIWRCNGKYEKGTHCKTPHLTEEKIKDAFVRAFNRMYASRAKLIEDYRKITEIFINTTDLDAKISELQAIQKRQAQDVSQCVDENLRVAQDQEAYNARYSELVMQFERRNEKIADKEKEKTKRIVMKEQIERFLDELTQKGPLLAFDEGVWYATVEKVTIGTDGSITFTFREGSIVLL
jgi:hypothetical protein